MIFFIAGLQMPPNPALADILLKFQVQLNQLMPNAVISSFGGVLSGDAFAKRYELHYQPKMMEIDRGVVFVQFGCLNFHAKRSRDGGPKLSLTIKNKCSTGWRKPWFYCRVPCHRSSEGGKSVFALCSRMSVLDYEVEPLVDCPDTDVNNVAFIWATTTLRGHAAAEEFLACGMYPLSVGFGFKNVIDDTTTMSMVVVPLPIFPSS
jgi:hypothetical protein